MDTGLLNYRTCKQVVICTVINYFVIALSTEKREVIEREDREDPSASSVGGKKTTLRQRNMAGGCLLKL